MDTAPTEGLGLIRDTWVLRRWPREWKGPSPPLEPSPGHPAQPTSPCSVSGSPCSWGSGWRGQAPCSPGSGLWAPSVPPQRGFVLGAESWGRPEAGLGSPAGAAPRAAGVCSRARLGAGTGLGRAREVCSHPCRSPRREALLEDRETKAQKKSLGQGLPAREPSWASRPGCLHCRPSGSQLSLAEGRPVPCSRDPAPRWAPGPLLGRKAGPVPQAFGPAAVPHHRPGSTCLHPARPIHPARPPAWWHPVLSAATKATSHSHTAWASRTRTLGVQAPQGPPHCPGTAHKPPGQGPVAVHEGHRPTSQSRPSAPGFQNRLCTQHARGWGPGSAPADPCHPAAHPSASSPRSRRPHSKPRTAPSLCPTGGSPLLS